MKNISFYIQDNSMLPTISNGDMILCRTLKPLEAIEEKGLYTIVTTTGAVMVKRVEKVFYGSNGVSQLKLVSDNAEKQDGFKIHVQNIRAVLKVVHTIKSEHTLKARA
jgi:phage repressor protein C with HTH and peptisase S24 domain